MQNVHYIIVGMGLSGLAVAERLKQQRKSVLVIDKPSLSASKIAGGMYNPVILKRFTLAWNANTQLEESLAFYKSLEKKLSVNFVKSLSVYRRFYSVEEQNSWFVAADKPTLETFIETSLTKQVHPQILGDLSFGKVKHTGIIDTETLIDSYKQHLISQNELIETHFNFDHLAIEDTQITYNNVSAKGIIFCEGQAISKNPYFNFLDVYGNKGEYLIIEAKGLQLNVAVKSNIFIIPLGNDLYKVGATYDRDDQSPLPTKKMREKLILQLNQLLQYPYTIVNQVAGIRPTTKDRRPYVGGHPNYNNLFVCNGLGSRGVMTSPVVARQLTDYLLHHKPLPEDINSLRHYKTY